MIDKPFANLENCEEHARKLASKYKTSVYITKNTVDYVCVLKSTYPFKYEPTNLVKTIDYTNFLKK